MNPEEDPGLEEEELQVQEPEGDRETMEEERQRLMWECRRNPPRKRLKCTPHSLEIEGEDQDDGKRWMMLPPL